MPVPSSDPPYIQPRLRLDVALVPSLLATDVPRGEAVFIVVDVIRATTSLCMLFERGCSEVLLAHSVDAVRALRPEFDGNVNSIDGHRVLSAGEVHGARPDGFDYGNSPAELASAPVAGRTVLFATTNGTRALRACAGGRAILAGALRNARAVADAALAEALAGRVAPELGSTASGEEVDHRVDIAIVCSGRDDQPAFDDTICSGYILRCLVKAAAAHGRTVELESGGQIALAALAGAEASGGIRTALAQSAAYQAIARIGLVGDLDWCAATDVTEVVPRAVGHIPDRDLIVMRDAGGDRHTG